LRICKFEYDTVEPGETVYADLSLTNFGFDIDSVYVLFRENHSGVTIITDSLYFGYIEYGDTVDCPIRLSAVPDDTLFPGTVLDIAFTMHGSRGYAGKQTLHLQSGLAPAQMFFTHENEKLKFTISNFGQFGFGSGAFHSLGYSGFTYGDAANLLFEAALLVGTDSLHVSDGARVKWRESDDDFRVAVGGELQPSIPGIFGDQETFSIFDDGRAENRIGLRISQRSYSWRDAPDDNYVILEYEVENAADTAITGIYAGLFFDWLYAGPRYDRQSVLSLPENLGYIFYRDTRFADSILWFRGLSVINNEGLQSYRAVVRPLNTYEYFDFPEAYKFAAISEGIVDPDLAAENNSEEPKGLMHFISTGPFAILPGRADTAVFAVMGAASHEKTRSTAQRARDNYHSLTAAGTVDNESGPGSFSLEQNYPNPFNPGTNIEYTLTETCVVELKIYDVLGRIVNILLDEKQTAGRHAIVWDGTDIRGQTVATGIYFYRLRAGDYGETRKMLLLR
jgi:hypothetical protein